MNRIFECTLAAVLVLALCAGSAQGKPAIQDGSSPKAAPEVRFSGDPGEKGSGPAALFGDDVLIADRDPDIEARLDMVSSDTRGMFLAWESIDLDNTHIYIYRSTDGGNSWHHFVNLVGGAAGDLHDPALALPENTQDYLYIAYEFVDNIWVTAVNLDTLEHTSSIVEGGSLGVHNPGIITDDCDYPGNYWLYVTWVIDTNLGGQEGHYVRVARSVDLGLSWEQYLSLYNTEPGGPLPYPDIGYGEYTLYVTWDGNEPGGSDVQDIYVARSTNLGLSWESSHNLTLGSSQTCYGPRVAAIRGDEVDGGEVVVVYNRLYSIDDVDIVYSYSDDQGVNWSGFYCLACLYSLHEARPDLDVDPSYGSFHVVYWQDYNTMHTSAHRSDPTIWSTPVAVNDTGQVDWELAPFTSAYDWTSGQRGVAWTDSRTPTYAAYYDRADWLPDVQTVACSYTCDPMSGVLPFATQMSVSMNNLYTGQLRRVSGSIDVHLAGGQIFGNWRAGWTNLAPGGSYSAVWMQNLPALASLAGTNQFTLVVEDVTPSPYNQPPYPAAGDTATGLCLVTGVLP